MARRAAGHVTEPLPDATLTLAAAEGDRSAFEELYRRHSEPAWRAAMAVTGNPHDAADAVAEAFTKVLTNLPRGGFPAEAPFLPYVLVAVRNAAIDNLRKRRRAEPASSEALANELPSSGPAETVEGALDAAMVADAFRGLPERWRTVLWLTEVEGLAPRDIAPVMGLSANGVAQLAVRARAGLRERFLQAHIGGTVERDCTFTVEHLGAYVGGALSARDVAKVDQHLAGCAACRERKAELEEVGSTLRRVIVPIPIAVGAAALAKWKAAAGASGAAAHAGWWGAESLARAYRPLAVAAATVLALGIIGLPFVDDPDNPGLTTPSRQGPRREGRPSPVVEGFTLGQPPQAASSIESVDDVARAQAARADQGRAAAPLPAGGVQAGNDGDASRGGGDGPPPPPPPQQPAEPTLEAGARLNPAATGLSAGVGGCTGLEVGGNVAGCAPQAGDGVLTISTRGVLGNNRLEI